MTIRKKKYIVDLDARLRILSALIIAKNTGCTDGTTFTAMLKMAAANAGCSVRTLQRWLERYINNGKDIQALKPSYKGSEPKAKTNRLFDAAIKIVIAYRKENMTLTVPQLLRVVESEFPDFVGLLKRSTVQLYLKRNNCNRTQIKKDTCDYREIYLRYRKKHVLDSVQCDVKELPKGLITDDSGISCNAYIQLCVDNHSRKIISFAVSTEQKVQLVTDSIKSLVCNLGIPKTLVLDNGSIYRSKILARAAYLLDMKLHYCRPYAAESKGMVERVNLDLNEIENDIKHLKNISIEGLREIVEIWVNEHNNRSHSTLDNKTPNQVFDADTFPRRFTTPDIINTAFRITKTRVIGKDGTVSINNISYKAIVDSSKGIYVNDSAEFMIDEKGIVYQVLDVKDIRVIEPLNLKSCPQPDYKTDSDNKAPADNACDKPAKTRGKGQGHKQRPDEVNTCPPRYCMALSRDKARRDGTYTTEDEFVRDFNSKFYKSTESRNMARGPEVASPYAVQSKINNDNNFIGYKLCTRICQTWILRLFSICHLPHLRRIYLSRPSISQSSF